MRKSTAFLQRLLSGHKAAFSVCSRCR